MSRWNAPLVLSLVLALLVSGRGAANATGPFLNVSPNPTTEREVTATGSEFCGAPACSTVTLVIDDIVVASGVKVGADGTFQVKVMAPTVAGEYVVTASQTDAQGKLILAQDALTVMAIDNIETTASPAPTPSSQPTPPAQTPTPAASPTTEPSATPGGGHRSTSPTPGAGSGSSMPTSTARADLDSDQEDDGAPAWLLATIAAVIGAFLLGTAIILRRLRRQ